MMFKEIVFTDSEFDLEFPPLQTVQFPYKVQIILSLFYFNVTSLQLLERTRDFSMNFSRLKKVSRQLSLSIQLVTPYAPIYLRKTKKADGFRPNKKEVW